MTLIQRITLIIIIIFINILLIYSFQFFNLKTLLPITLTENLGWILLLEISLILLLIFQSYYQSKYSFSKIQRIKQKLRVMLKANKYYRTSAEDGFEKIYTALVLKFYFREDLLIIEAHAGGAPFTSKANDLGDQLQSALGLSLIEQKASNPKFMQYTLSNKKIERIYLRSIADIQVTKGCIPLDTVKHWDYAKIPHALISGVTSGGKTFMLFSLMLQLAADGADLYIADPKQAELASLKHTIPAGFDKVASTNNHILRLCRIIIEKMNRRYSDYFDKPNVRFGSTYRDFNLRPCFLIVDEVASLMAMLDRKAATELEDGLKQIIMKGRQAGVFLILATQKPEAEVIATAIRDQFGLRIALGQMSKMGLKQTLGEFDDLPIAETGTGKGYIFIDGQHWNLPRGFTAPFLDMETLNFQETLTELLLDGEKKFAIQTSTQGDD